MDEIGEWELDKYARMTARTEEEGREWKTLDDSPTRPLVLILTKAGILTVQIGRLLLEYWNLLQVKGMKVHTRGDCMLFLCKAKEDVLRWRVKFGGGATAGEKRCNTCARAVNSFLVSPAGPDLQTQAPLLPGPQQAFPDASTQGLLLPLQPRARAALPRPSSGVRPPPGWALAYGAYALAPPVDVPPGVAQDYLGTTGATPAGDPAPGRAGGVGADGRVLRINEEAPGGRSTWMVARSSSTRGTTARDPLEAGGGAGPLGVAPASSLLELFGDKPNLEQLVREVLLDPRLPDLVEAVNKIISDM